MFLFVHLQGKEHENDACISNKERVDINRIGKGKGEKAIILSKLSHGYPIVKYMFGMPNIVNMLQIHLKM